MAVTLKRIVLRPGAAAEGYAGAYDWVPKDTYDNPDYAVGFHDALWAADRYTVIEVAAVEQAMVEGQNIPTIFPHGSIGASTQPSEEEPLTVELGFSLGSVPIKIPTHLSTDLADARAALREVAALLLNCQLPEHLILRARAWLALPAVMAAREEKT